MPALSDTQKSQTRFHLAYTAATPTGDRARLEAAMDQIPDSWTVTRLGLLLTRCETAYTATELTEGDLIDDEQIRITGDVVRTTTEAQRDTWAKRQRYYLLETNSLALALGVRNYRDPEQAPYKLIRPDGTIPSLPSLNWNDIINKPGVFTPSSHGHGIEINPAIANYLNANNYLTQSDGDSRYFGIEPHESASDPHPQYLTAAEGNAAYAPIGVSGSTNLSMVNRNASTLDIASDTGADATVPAVSTSLAGLMAAADKSKLDGVSAGATANSTDSFLLNRVNHTGSQGISTITALQSTLDGKQNLDSDLTEIAAITPTNGQFMVRGASVWGARTLQASDIPGTLANLEITNGLQWGTAGNQLLRSGSTGDTALRLFRGTSSEYISLGAAAGGTLFGGTTNTYYLDSIGPGSSQARALEFRFSENGGSSFTTAYTLSSTLFSLGSGVGFTCGGTAEIRQSLNMSGYATDQNISLTRAGGGTGDRAIKFFRSGTTEYMQLGAAAGGSLFGALNNAYTIDLISPNTGTARSLLIRFSTNGGSSYSTAFTFGNSIISTGLAFLPRTSTVANLPTGISAGAIAYTTNGRKSGEGAGAGTGCPVWFDGTFWRTYYDNSVVQA